MPSDHAGIADRAERESRIIRTYRESVRRFAGRWVDATDAEDVAQETLRRVLVAVRGRRIEAGNEPPSGYVFRTARHVCMHIHRSHRRGARAVARLRSEVDATEPVPDPSVVLEQRERDSRVRACLADLTQRDRGVLLAFYRDGRSTDEVADELGISPGAVRVRRHRAVRRLRELVRAPTGRSPGG